jgi:phosphate-selective porin OprO/OprP
VTNHRRIAPTCLVYALLASTVTAGQTIEATIATDPVKDGRTLTLQARIAELERQLETLKQQLARGGDAEPATAVDASTADGRTSLEDRIEELDQRLRVLAREEEIRREALAEQARTAPAITASRDGFQLRSADGAFSLRLRGLVQSDNRVFINDAVDSGVDSFVLRRVRPIFDATLFKNFDLRLMPDFGNGTTVLQDAYMDLKFGTAFRIRAGKQKQPFGLERLVSASELTLIERALPTTVAGNRDVGVMAYGDLLAGRLTYYAGAFNGVVDGGSADFDDRDGKEIITRLFTHPFRTSKNARLQGLGIGVAASYGAQRGTAAAPGLATYRSAGQQTYFRYLSDGTANGTTLADGDRRRWSAQGYYYAGRFGVLGEHVSSSQDVRRGTQRATADTVAWQVAPVWVLTGERASYRGVAPRAPFDRANGTWGAFELTARYNELEVGDELFPLFASPTAAARRARGGAAGLNWYINRNVKVAFNYEETHFSGGAAQGNRRPERDFLSRVQFSF